MNFQIGFHGTNLAQCQYAFFHNTKAEGKVEEGYYFPRRIPDNKILLWDGRRTAVESMAAGLSSNVSPKYEGLDLYITMTLFWLKGMTDITIADHSPFLYRNSHKTSLTVSCCDHFSRVVHLNTCMRFTNAHYVSIFHPRWVVCLFFRANRPCKTTSKSLSPLLMVTSSAAVLQTSLRLTDFQIGAKIRDFLSDSTTL